MFKAFVTNLGKYNQGDLVGEWVEFPTTGEEMRGVLRRIGIGENDEFGCPYEEFFISDYDYDMGCLSGKLGEYENLEVINYLAGRLEDLDVWEENVFSAAVDICDDATDAVGLINLSYNLDNYQLLPDVSNDSDLGYYWIEQSGCYDTSGMGSLANYIDYEAFGRDVAMEERGDFTSVGYVYDTGETFVAEFSGDPEDIPDEYRLWLNEEEEDDMDGIGELIA